jgi:Rrf2 family transcriptional regulator, cysteine metabolism repressor
MRMSTKGRYGLRIMVELATRYGQGPVLVESIAASQGLSANYIHLLATGLKTSGLLRSVRGPAGGYELARDPGEINAQQVVSAIEGDAVVECVDTPGQCERAGCCATRDVWLEVKKAIEVTLARHTLRDLAEAQHVKDGQASMFHI